MASPRASGLSFAFTFAFFVYSHAILSTIFFFLCIHAVMVYLTCRDPYFMETLTARLRCGKTDNLKKSGGNRYEP